MSLGRGSVRNTAAAALFATGLGCGPQRPAEHAEPTLADLRKLGPQTRSAETAGRWLLAELVSPGGEAARAIDARKRLDGLTGGDMVAELARGLDDSVHGKLKSAPDHLFAAVRAARASSDPRAPLIAWYAAEQATRFRHDAAPGLFTRWRPFVEEAMTEPLALGWRARSELVEWWVDEAYDRAAEDVEKQSASRYGCIPKMRLAGPFGRGAGADAIRSFAAEQPGPWPAAWPSERGMGRAPRVVEVERHGCTIEAKDPVGHGIFYAETYLILPEERELVIAVQGALSVWVDDSLVLDRNPRRWGVWPKFGVRLRLSSGRHRLLARLADPRTTMRILRPDGAPLDVEASDDAAPGYSMAPPERGPDPNALDPWIHDGNVRDPKDDLVRFAGAWLAHVEGQDDVASVMLEPLVQKPDAATGPALASAAIFVAGDPIFAPSQAQDLVNELHERASTKDPQIWTLKLALALGKAQSKGPTEAVRDLRALADQFREVPMVLRSLSRLYGELGWSAELSETARLLAERFPEDVDALGAAVEVLDHQGANEKADSLAKRILELAPDSEIALQRALAREDYPAARIELERLAARRPERKDIPERLYDVMVRAGNESETWKKLEAALEKEPLDVRPRLALADAHLAAGEHDALRKALAEAVTSGAGSEPLRDAIDLVEGVTALEPYRMASGPVIAEFEKSGRSLPGTAARVLDYAAVWVRADGSSSMLEHELVRIQSAEGIAKFAEQSQLEGLVLHMRVIKKDGRVLEPEVVPGKPTVTFPHLEVGDYVETEHVVANPGDGQRGVSYLGPRWFFREENVAYARSEFLVISPRSKPLVVETTGDVPEPQLSQDGELIVRRWRVDSSPAAPVEPQSAPITEFLPSVAIGWGITLELRLRNLADSTVILTPVDSRIARVARRIVESVPKASRREQAKLAYRWVLANVEDGNENDGRRVVIGKQGNRWRGFLELCRALGIPAEYAIVQNRLAEPPKGALSRAALFSDPLLRLDTDKGAVWLTVGSKYAPFAYVPAELQGMPAYRLGGPEPVPATVPAIGALDLVSYKGKVKLAADGSAKIELTQSYHGKYAMGLRQALAQLPEQQLHDVLESRLLGRALRGARLVSHRIDRLEDLDAPLEIHMTAQMPGFANPTEDGLALAPPFVLRISQLAALPSRQTPLLLVDATHQSVELEVELPPNAKLEALPAPAKIADADRGVAVEDTLKGNLLRLHRSIDLPAGRIKPADYARFVDFAQRADELAGREIRIRLGK